MKLQHGFACVIFFALSAQVQGDDPVTIDGRFTEWTNDHLEWIGPEGDSQGIDFRRLWIRDEAKRMYIAVEAIDDFDLSENNSIILLLDTDNNPITNRRYWCRDTISAWRTYRTILFHSYK